MKLYSVRYECDECPEVYASARDAARCCRTGDYSEVYRCGGCKTIHVVPDLAKQCCSKMPAAPIEPLREHPASRPSVPAATSVVRPPKPGCEYCSMAQRFGKVISCRCMKG